MDDLVFEIVRFVIVVAIILFARYAIPYIKRALESEKMNMVVQWVESAVLYAQQVFQTSTGAEKKEIVKKFLLELLQSKHISITEEQLDILIESAVKAMKLQESYAYPELDYNGEETEENEGDESSSSDADQIEDGQTEEDIEQPAEDKEPAEEEHNGEDQG